MNQELFPEIQVATQALETRIAITETEVAQLKQQVADKRQLLRAWRKALSAFGPKRAAPKQRAGHQRKSTASTQTCSA
jgi:DNA/RNA-binding domain of Phe-tRNA-synthetase-like protein